VRPGPTSGWRLRASRRLRELRRTLRDWFEFRDGYDPSFGWWTKAPYAAADAALDQLATTLRERADAGPGDQSLRGDPIGEAALQRELGFEWIPYTPAELVAIAEREFAFCDAEMAAGGDRDAVHRLAAGPRQGQGAASPARRAASS
jgi:hypothetical protein